MEYIVSIYVHLFIIEWKAFDIKSQLDVRQQTHCTSRLPLMS